MAGAARAEVPVASLVEERRRAEEALRSAQDRVEWLDRLIRGAQPRCAAAAELPAGGGYTEHAMPAATHGQDDDEGMARFETAPSVAGRSPMTQRTADQSLFRPGFKLGDSGSVHVGGSGSVVKSCHSREGTDEGCSAGARSAEAILGRGRSDPDSRVGGDSRVILHDIWMDAPEEGRKMSQSWKDRADSKRGWAPDSPIRKIAEKRPDVWKSAHQLYLRRMEPRGENNIPQRRFYKPMRLSQQMMSMCGANSETQDDTRRSVAQRVFWRNMPEASRGKLSTQNSVCILELMHTVVVKKVDATEKVKECADMLRGIGNRRDPVGAALVHFALLTYATTKSIMAWEIFKFLVDEVKEVDVGQDKVDIVNLQYDESLFNSEADTKTCGRIDPSPDGLGKYDGESLLHLAIVFRLKEVLELLFKSPRKPYLYPRVEGTFFLPGRAWTNRNKARTYFGEFPFHFAVAVGDIEIADIILKHATVPGAEDIAWAFLDFRLLPDSEVAFDRMEKNPAGNGVAQRLMLRSVDSYGNTPLHIAVLHRQRQMYNWLLERHQDSVAGLRGDAPDKEVHSVLHTLGPQKLTPLGLATVLGHETMFNHVLESMEELMWKLGSTAVICLNLKQIDTVPIIEQTEQQISLSRLEKRAPPSIFRLVYLWRIEDLALHDTLVRIQDHKWIFLRWLSWSSLAVHVIFLVMITVLSYEFAAIQSHHGSRTEQIIVLEVIVGLGCICFLFMDAFDAYQWVQFAHRDTQGIRGKGMDKKAPAELKDVDASLASSPRRSPHGMSAVPISGLAPADDHDFEDPPPFLYGRDNAPIFMPGRRTFMSLVPLSHYDVLMWAGAVSFTLHFISYSMEGFGREEGELTAAALAMSTICFYVSTLKYSLINKSLAMLVNTILSCCLSDFLRFVVIYLICLMGFGTGLWPLYYRSHDEDQKESATNWPDLAWGLDILIRRSFGDIGSNRDQWIRKDSGNATFAYLLMLAWTLFSMVVSLNLLISMFSSTYTAMETQAEAKWRVMRGRAILLWERRILFLPVPCWPQEQKMAHLRVNDAPAVEPERMPFRIVQMDDRLFLTLPPGPHDDDDDNQEDTTRSSHGKAANRYACKVERVWGSKKDFDASGEGSGRDVFYHTVQWEPPENGGPPKGTPTDITEAQWEDDDDGLRFPTEDKPQPHFMIFERQEHDDDSDDDGSGSDSDDDDDDGDGDGRDNTMGGLRENTTGGALAAPPPYTGKLARQSSKERVAAAQLQQIRQRATLTKQGLSIRYMIRMLKFLVAMTMSAKSKKARKRRMSRLSRHKPPQNWAARRHDVEVVQNLIVRRASLAPNSPGMAEMAAAAAANVARRAQLSGIRVVDHSDQREDTDVMRQMVTGQAPDDSADAQLRVGTEAVGDRDQTVATERVERPGPVLAAGRAAGLATTRQKPGLMSVTLPASSEQSKSRGMPGDFSPPLAPAPGPAARFSTLGTMNASWSATSCRDPPGRLTSGSTFGRVALSHPPPGGRAAGEGEGVPFAMSESLHLQRSATDEGVKGAMEAVPGDAPKSEEQTSEASDVSTPGKTSYDGASTLAPQPSCTDTLRTISHQTRMAMRGDSRGDGLAPSVTSSRPAAAAAGTPPPAGAAGGGGAIETPAAPPSQRAAAIDALFAPPALPSLRGASGVAEGAAAPGAGHAAAPYGANGAADQ